jgi:hypothetical protein
LTDYDFDDIVRALLCVRRRRNYTYIFVLIEMSESLLFLNYCCGGDVNGGTRLEIL